MLRAKAPKVTHAPTACEFVAAGLGGARIYGEVQASCTLDTCPQYRRFRGFVAAGAAHLAINGRDQAFRATCDGTKITSQLISTHTVVETLADLLRTLECEQDGLDLTATWSVLGGRDGR